MPRIVRFARHGGPEVLEVREEPLEEPGEGEVRLKIEAIGLNRAEIMLRNGAYVSNPTFPSRIGIEASGVIDAVGPGVSGLSIGERAGAVPFNSWDQWGNWTNDSVNKYGLYGESAVVRRSCCPRSAWPAILTGYRRSRAGALWCQYGTAWGGLVDHAGVSSDDIVLVTAASSSAALAGLQIAKNAGAMVIAATRRSDKAEFLFGAGADHVVATEEEDLGTRVKEITSGQGFTIAYDPVGGAFIGDLVAAAQPYGLIVNYGNLRTEPIDIPVLPMLAKRLFFKFHSLYDTMRLPEKRAACFAFVHDEVASGALKADHRPDLPAGADRGRASLHGNQRAARQDRRHHLRLAEIAALGWRGRHPRFCRTRAASSEDREGPP